MKNNTNKRFSEKMKILLCRTDRLGDLIQTLPAVKLTKILKPNSELSILTKKEYNIITENSPYISHRLSQEEVNIKFLRENKFDIVIMFLYKTKLALNFFRTIPERIGPLSKPTSFLLLNRGKRQNRSKSKLNEAKYNIDLIKHAFRDSTDVELRPEIFFRMKRVQGLPDKYVVLAPQMRSSARNFRREVYENIVRFIKNKNIHIVLTGTKENCNLKYFTDILNDKFLNLVGKTNLRELTYVLDNSELVIAPSTGTIHLANALRKKIFSIYPSDGPTGYTRWHPWNFKGIILKGIDNQDYSISVSKDLIYKNLKELLD